MPANNPRRRLEKSRQGRRVRIRRGPVEEIPKHTTGENINPGWEEINIRFHPERTNEPRYSARTREDELRHERGHVHQAIFHHRRGFKLNVNSTLAVLEDRMIRQLGFASKPANEYFSMSRRDILIKMKNDLKSAFPGATPVPSYIATLFPTKRALLFAVVRAYRDPKMSRLIDELNTYNTYMGIDSEIIQKNANNKRN